LGIELRFEGEGVNETGVVSAITGNDAPAVKIGDVLVRVDARYFRPAEVETLLGDATRAKTELGWEPEITAQEMCKEMVLHDLNEAKRNALLRKHGYSVSMSHES
jgi:GDPmannose 4,6-dehydratase